MNDGPRKLHTGYLVEGLELFILKVAYTKYDATVLFAGLTIGTAVRASKQPTFVDPCACLFTLLTGGETLLPRLSEGSHSRSEFYSDLCEQTYLRKKCILRA
jgi:hypothetical protein